MTTSDDFKADLVRYLRRARESVVWKLDGLSEYDVRRPLTPTGTNLLGLVKHLASVEVGYFGEVFGRPFPEKLPWNEELDVANLSSLSPEVLMADMWAAADESREYIVGLYRRAWAHSDATIEALDLDATGRVPWWTNSEEVTLHRLLVHMTAETYQHAGHVDIVRELIDGKAGLREGSTNLPDVDQAWWEAYHSKLERVASEVGQQ
ncbi:MAG TPA: DinB family protein [Streptosporangiaceae bacterium]|nr:DinB family protein [Streptosporangiaceae bacterium]